MFTRHLSKDAIVRLAERPEAASGDRHLATCARCRRKVEEIGEVLAFVGRGEVPDPSPLFWDHLSQRIGAAIEQKQPPPREARAAEWTRVGWKMPVLATVSAALIAVAVFLRMPEPAQTEVGLPGQAIVTDSPQITTGDALAGEWEFVETVASYIDNGSEEVLGDQLAHRRADQLVDGLSPEEQTELARLVQAEMVGPGAQRSR